MRDFIDIVSAAQAHPYLVEGPMIDGRIVPRLANGDAPQYLYRIMSNLEYVAGMATGLFRSTDGRLHADVVPHFEYAGPGVNHLVQIAYYDDDGWKTKWTSLGCVAITEEPLSMHRMSVVASGSRDDLENGWGATV